MGKQKEMYMQMQQEELAQQNPSINQLNNNKMTKKTNHYMSLAVPKVKKKNPHSVKMSIFTLSTKDKKNKKANLSS